MALRDPDEVLALLSQAITNQEVDEPDEITRATVLGLNAISEPPLLERRAHRALRDCVPGDRASASGRSSGRRNCVSRNCVRGDCALSGRTTGDCVVGLCVLVVQANKKRVVHDTDALQEFCIQFMHRADLAPHVRGDSEPVVRRDPVLVLANGLALFPPPLKQRPLQVIDVMYLEPLVEHGAHDREVLGDAHVGHLDVVHARVPDDQRLRPPADVVLVHGHHAL
mmetsp:Transcript_84110/g.256967  ORF Transcript_84110/g.256967 Transcript_84110/m.256967 type:complete len:225 (-) Transcript_84110:276-950(-)